MLPVEITCVVGIDVAKAAHVVCALRAPSGAVQQRPTRFEATAEGYAQLLAWLAAWGTAHSVLVGLEATGVLWEPLYEHLRGAGYTVLVLNPRQTSSWATSLGLRAKTDGVDAQTLARGLLAGYARASTVPDETVQALRALTRTRRDLVQTRTAAVQRLHDELVLLFPELVRHLATWPGTPKLTSLAVLQLLSTYSSAATVASATPDELTHLLEEVSSGRWGAAQASALQDLAQHSIASSRAVAARALVVRTLALHLLDLQTRLAELETAIAELLRSDAPGQHLQQQVPGVGPKIAATVRAELGDVTRFSRVDQVLAYAGLEPRTRQSGAYVGQTHLSKHGPGALRHALYLAVLSAVRTRPEWRTRYERLLARGRAKKEALAILSRALLKIIYHLLRTGATYDPALVKPRPPAAGA